MSQPINPNIHVDYTGACIREIYLAGGCFWGLEAYMRRVYGVISVESGYANGIVEQPSYEEVCTGQTEAAETVKVVYDGNRIDVRRLLLYFLRVVDPTSLNRQGNDVGTQYRCGIFYTIEEDKPIIEQVLAERAGDYNKPMVIEVEPLRSFYKAEEYHQEYLEKNPAGYCHINLFSVQEPVIDEADYPVPNQEILKENLPQWSYYVTQENGTESPFSSAFYQHKEMGIYVDITTGEPLFTSIDKFDSYCGWPSFAHTISEDVVNYSTDTTHNMVRTEVRSRAGNAHLGHVFDDGPQELGGKRYCINGAALRFVPVERLEEEGYGYLAFLFN